MAQSQLIKNLKAGKSQTLVVYGTSLSAGGSGIVWVNTMSADLNGKYQNRLKVINSGKGAQWSTWGVQHLEDSVIKKKPDAVMVEFSINDAYLDFKTSPQLARLNLNYIIDRIKLSNSDCEIILQIMNIPVGESAKVRPNLEEYVQMYKQVARERKLRLIDHSPYWKDILKNGQDAYLKYVPDGIHPDVKSARELIAPFVVKKLEE